MNTYFLSSQKMETKQQSISTSRSKRITKRKIKHGSIKLTSQNKNCPKFILGHCLINFKNRLLELCNPQEKVYVNQSFRVVDRWLSRGQKDKLTIKHLQELLGKGRDKEDQLRQYHFSRIYFQFLAKHTLNNIMGNKKVEKVLSYMICLQKFTARLARPELMYKLQFK